jgi:DNA-binding response OmpR family regulator
MSCKPRLLLVDDDPLVRRTLSEMLEAIADVTVSASADLPAGPFDLVVGDAGGRHAGTPLVPLQKPVRAGALLAAIDAALAVAPALRLGPWRLDVQARCLADDAGRRVKLTDKECAILTTLAKAGQAVSRQDLLAGIWGYGAQVATHTLETHVYRLRRKIETDPDDARLLVTEPGGYRLHCQESE